MSKLSSLQHQGFVSDNVYLLHTGFSTYFSGEIAETLACRDFNFNYSKQCHSNK